MHTKILHTQTQKRNINKQGNSHIRIYTHREIHLAKKQGKNGEKQIKQAQKVNEHTQC